MKYMNKRFCAFVLFLALFFTLATPVAWGASGAPSDAAAPGQTEAAVSAAPGTTAGTESAAPEAGASAEPSAVPSPSPSPSPSPTPTPQPDDVSPSDLKIQAKAGILVDVSGEVPEILFQQRAHERMYPASITKIMTALLVLEAVESGKLSLDQAVTASDDITADLVADGSTANIKPGEEMSVENLLYCMLLSSANEACNILAEAVDGSRANFIAHMNRRAQELGCENTQFINAHGLPSTEHYTTAYDIFLMCQAAMKHATFRLICGSTAHTVPATNMSDERVLRTTNYMLTNQLQRGKNYYFANATGIKTGYTDQAGYCLAASATEGNRSLISVVLGAENVKQEDGSFVRNSFQESRRLLKWGLDNFRRKALIDPTIPVKEIAVRLSKEADYVALKPEGPLEATLFTGIDPADFEQKIVVETETIDAPVEEGQVLGTLTVSYQGNEYGTVNLVAVSSLSRSQSLYLWDQVRKFFANPFVKLVLLVVIILLIIHFIRRWLGLSKKSRARAAKRKAYRGRRRR